MGGGRLLAQLLEREPSTYLALEEITGPLGIYVEGEDWFNGTRPPFGVEDPLSRDIRRVFVSFDPFREPGPDPPLIGYHVEIRISVRRARRLMRSAAPTFLLAGGGVAATHLHWTAPSPELDTAIYDDRVRSAYLAHLPAALETATTPTALREACSPPPAAGLRMSAQPKRTWGAAGNLVPARAPLVCLYATPAIDARRLCATWKVDRPIAVSGDVHQVSWSIFRAGEELTGHRGPVLAAERLQYGVWQIRLELSGRPKGPLPGVSSGASPAYDVLERGGEIVRIDVEAGRALEG